MSRPRWIRWALIILGVVMIIVGNITVAAQADPFCPAQPVGTGGLTNVQEHGDNGPNWFLFIVGMIVLVCVSFAWGGRRERDKNNDSNTTV